MRPNLSPWSVCSDSPPRYVATSLLVLSVPGWGARKRNIKAVPPMTPKTLSKAMLRPLIIFCVSIEHLLPGQILTSSVSDLDRRLLTC